MVLRQRAVLIVIIIVVLAAVGFLAQRMVSKGGDEVGPKPFRFDDSAISAAFVLGQEHQLFTHPQYGFSVEYPKELEVRAFQEDEESESITFQKPKEKFGFQIFISPFDEEIEILTKERVLEDLPFAQIEEAQEAVFGTQGIHGLLFWSQGPNIGKTRELWFVKDGYLYEITTYAELDEWLAQIMNTWKFQQSP